MIYEEVTQKGVGISIAPAVIKIDTTGTAFDLAQYSSATIVLTAGAYVDTTFVFTLTECDTSGGTYTDVASTDIVGTPISVETTSAAAQVGIIGYIGDKRYIKVVATKGGTASTGSIIGAYIIGGFKRYSSA